MSEDNGEPGSWPAGPEGAAEGTAPVQDNFGRGGPRVRHRTRVRFTRGRRQRAGVLRSSRRSAGDGRTHLGAVPGRGPADIPGAAT